jgi:hypothetical protein
VLSTLLKDSSKQNEQFNHFFLWRCGPARAIASPFMRFPVHTQRRATDGSTSLGQWSACCKDHYMTTHNTYKVYISMLLAEFESTVPADERPQTYTLDRAVTWTGSSTIYCWHLTGKSWRRLKGNVVIMYRRKIRIRGSNCHVQTQKRLCSMPW